MREESRLVPWSQIERVERVSSGAGRGALHGAGAGLVLGIAVAAGLEPDRSDPGNSTFYSARLITRLDRVAAATICSAFGAITGSLVGHAFPRCWTIAP